MKKIFNALKFTCVFSLILAVFVSCDKDFNTIQSDVIAAKNFNTDYTLAPITSYNRKLDSVKINNLGASLFGVFNDPVYGQTKASIVAQVIPSSFNPSFGDNPKIESVILNIPYYSRAITDSTYTIKDSLFGDSPIKLSIYQNNYFLRDFDPNSETNSAQNYYSYANNPANNTDNFAVTENGTINFDDFKSADTLYYDPSFVPSSDAIVITKTASDGTETTERLAPALRVELDTTFWKSAILDKVGSTELSNANNFINYFRGLYFKAEPIGNDGNMILFNLGASGANITINYSYDSTITDGERVQSSYVLSFTGIKLNTFINDFTTPLENGDPNLGDEKLYLKGTGSMAVVDLFTGLVDYTDENEVTTQIPALEAFKKTYRAVDDNGDYIIKNGDFVLKRLINEAQLVVHEDETMAEPTDDYHKYDRLYAYDIKNNIPLADYDYDPTGNTTDPFNSRYIHLGQRMTDDNGVTKYKIRITEQLNNILLKDSTNTKIGLVLSTNVNQTSGSALLDSYDDVSGVPSMSLLTPRGTVLYGSNQNVAEDKRMVLEIFSTVPDTKSNN
ncbi:hypothetical protein GCM10007962_17600 [Yeosuana aromativorans]|uniref:DUF4270 domain-containing protein n=1 Tax=Yeosuana aromativorans TaxID=288019 RepID=A0A8J3BNB6_9FLAO|nr:DUF4270 domain-containing protein [Yeosuana aromativorans]GGK23842.1 hypothetical protein GCM10007962_17600 [Yeosuana aromativorans]